ncbi:MAG: Translation initiation factor 2 subunit gamma [Promethearchaeota archaeon]|nr:MAG: Translation initiation factor 2 subunit gamma [Candidatus Lokiarchaeota archaeon]
MKIAGIDTVQKLASSKLDDLLNIKGIGKSTAEKYILEANILLESKKKEKKVPKKRTSISKLKEIIKQQAECNIGLVGHVDHGTSWKFLPLL